MFWQACEYFNHVPAHDKKEVGFSGGDVGGLEGGWFQRRFTPSLAEKSTHKYFHTIKKMLLSECFLIYVIFSFAYTQHKCLEPDA